MLRPILEPSLTGYFSLPNLRSWIDLLQSNHMIGEVTTNSGIGRAGDMLCPRTDRNNMIVSSAFRRHPVGLENCIYLVVGLLILCLY